MAVWERNFQSLLNIFLKSCCTLCQRSTCQEFCQNCHQQLQRAYLPNPSVFGMSSPSSALFGDSYGGTLEISDRRQGNIKPT